MLHYLDEFFYMQIRSDQLQVLVRGWVGADPYDIVIRADGQEVYRFANNMNRPDVCAVMGEEMHDNLYGYKDTFIIDSHVNVLAVCCEVNGSEEEIDSRILNMNPDEQQQKEMYRQRKLIYKEGCRRHPGMSRDRRNRYKLERRYGIPVHRVFEPSDPADYREWLKHQSYYYEGRHNRNVTFVIDGAGKVKIPFGYRSLHMKELDLSRIHTEYVCFVHDSCRLYPQFYPYLIKAEEYDLLYSDSDHISSDGQRIDPDFKPDYAPETLRSFNYIGGVFIVRKELLKPLDHTPVRLYRYLLEISEKPLHAGHISRVLFQEREREKDTAAVLKDYFRAKNRKVQLKELAGGEMCEVHFLPSDQPLISIIIPTKDHREDLERCLSSIFARTSYPSYEIVLIDNNSEKEETMAYFRTVVQEHENVSVHRLEVPFNYSYLNNEAVRKYAHGDYVVLLNNDTEVISPHWLEDMLGWCEQEGVGSVGVKLVYPDGSLQHAGVIIGRGGVADHAYYRYDGNIAGYGCSLQTARNVSGCTAACLMVKRSAYLAVGGFNEDIRVAFNDVDFMLKLLQKGYRNVFLPFVSLRHYESKSRGIDDSEEKKKRFAQERAYMLKHWHRQLQRDAYYNDNFAKYGFYKLRCRRSFGPFGPEEDPDCH